MAEPAFQHFIYLLFSLCFLYAYDLGGLMEMKGLCNSNAWVLDGVVISWPTRAVAYDHTCKYGVHLQHKNDTHQIFHLRGKRIYSLDGLGLL